MMKIEKGKYYRNRRGEKIGPMEHSIGGIAYPWFAANICSTFTNDGALHAGHETAGDLVAEWQDSQPVTDESGVSVGAGASPLNIGIDLARGPDTTVISHTVLLSWPDTASPEYAPLAAILQEAYDQAATGKGKERHARGLPFLDQPILEIGRMCGPGFDTGQSIKKQQEAMGMLMRGERDAAIRELLGAINYTAAAILLIREQNPGA